MYVRYIVSKTDTLEIEAFSDESALKKWTSKSVKFSRVKESATVCFREVSL